MSAGWLARLRPLDSAIRMRSDVNWLDESQKRFFITGSQRNTTRVGLPLAARERVLTYWVGGVHDDRVVGSRFDLREELEPVHEVALHSRVVKPLSLIHI